MINSYETACTGMGLEISSSSLEQLRRFSRDAERGRESLEEILQTSQEQRDLLKDIVQGSNDLKKNYLAVDECLSLLLAALSGDPVDERKFLERRKGRQKGNDAFPLSHSTSRNNRQDRVNSCITFLRPN